MSFLVLATISLRKRELVDILLSSRSHVAVIVICLFLVLLFVTGHILAYFLKLGYMDQWNASVWPEATARNP